MIDETKWNEEDHPRGEGGRFTSGGGGSSKIPSNARAVEILGALEKPDADNASPDKLRGMREELEALAGASENEPSPRVQRALDRIDRILGDRPKKPRHDSGYAYGLDGSSDRRSLVEKRAPGAHQIYK